MRRYGSDRYRTRYRLDEEDCDGTVHCPDCDRWFKAWMGASVVECPYCGRVFI